MASGCSSSCSDNLFKKTTKDFEVEYTGPAIPQLGICTHDLLSEVEAVILSKLIDYSTGIGITLPNIDLTICDLFTQEITCCGKGCIDLPCLMDIVFRSLCTLYGSINTLSDEISALLQGPYDVKCLSGLGSNPTLTAIIQELIIEFCNLVGRVDTLEDTVSTLSLGLATTIGNFLNGALSSCQSSGLTKAGSGSSFTATFSGFVPIGAILPYAGNMSIFDTSGLGRAGTDACGFAIANGSNGTVDMRGFVPVGAINGMGGGTLNAKVVDAGASPSAVYSLGDTVGEIRHGLIAAEAPAVPLNIDDASTTHIHGFVGRQDQYRFGNDNHAIDAVDPSSSVGGPFFSGIDGVIAPTTLHITGSTGGGNRPHENRQPSVAVYFIQRIS